MPPIGSPLRILAAGSLRAALTALAANLANDLGANNLGMTPELVFGPAGWLRERIEAGEACDLFLSANLDHPHALASRASGARVVTFAANRLVVIARPALCLTPSTLLARLLRDAVAIGTSTPRLDPGGDYADRFFARADRLVPGADIVLRAKARRLVGGRASPAVPAGQHPIAWFLGQGEVDVFLAYATTARLIADYAVIQPPPELAVTALYGAVTLTTDPLRQQTASAFLQHLLSSCGQEILARHGFLDPAPP